jgi:hypothetical protein
MSTKTREFLALALMGRIEEIRAELDWLGMEKLKIRALDLLHDAKGGGFNGLYAWFESVLRVEPCLGSEVVRKVLDQALDVAEDELVAVASELRSEKEVGQ